MDTVLKIENLHCQVQGQQILKGLNLEIKRGEVHAIICLLYTSDAADES